MAEEAAFNGVDSPMNGISKKDRDNEEHSRASDLERKIEALEEEKLEIIRENRDQKERIKHMTLEIDGFGRNQEALEGRIEKMRSEMEQWEEDKEALKNIAARASDLETELFRLQHDFQTSSTDGQEARSELRKMAAYYEALKRSSREKDSKINDLEREKELAVERLEKSKAEMGIRVRNVEEEAEKAKEEMEALRSSLEEKLKHSVETSKETEKILNDLKLKNKAMEAKLIEIAEEKVEMEKRMEEMEKELDKEEATADGNGGRRGFKFQWPVAAAASTGTIAVAVAMIYLRNAKQR